VADLPVACALSPAALKARRENLLNALLRRAATRHELTDGYRLRFTVTVKPNDGPISLDLTGPAGARVFLEAMFEER